MVRLRSVLIWLSQNQDSPDWRRIGPAIVCLAAATCVVASLPWMCDSSTNRRGERPGMAIVEPGTAKVEWCELVDAQGRARRMQLCDAPTSEEIVSPAGTDCGEALPWNACQPIPWEMFGPGEYLGMGRAVEVPEYRLRAGDELEVLYRLTGVESAAPYELNVGDRIRIESLTDSAIERELLVQPDGMIAVPVLGQVRAARRTLMELRDDLEAQYLKYYKSPAISVTPISVNSRLEELRLAIRSGTGNGAQVQTARVTPEGTIQLPAIGSVPAQGLTLDELKLELDERYAVVVEGVGVTPRLARRAPRFVYVVGAVRAAGRYTLEAPTSLMQALTLAGGWTKASNLRQVVVLRRGEDWRLMATRLDVRASARGTDSCVPGDIWLRDGDMVVVPENHWFGTSDWLDMLITRHFRTLPPAPTRTFSVQQMSAL